MNIAIVGSRTFADYSTLESFILQNISIEEIDYIVSGGAKGADSLAEKFANNFNLKTLIFRPDWDLYGKSAGYRRNISIIENSDIVFAFWDGISKGTKHSIDLAHSKGKKLYMLKIRRKA